VSPGLAQREARPAHVQVVDLPGPALRWCLILCLSYDLG
jgi:hypothetical protein